MKIVPQEIIEIGDSTFEDEDKAYHLFEVAARTCYQSQKQSIGDARLSFLKGLKIKGHTSIFEHVSFIIEMPENILMALMSELMQVHKHGYIHVVNVGQRGIIEINFRTVLELFEYKQIDFAASMLGQILQANAPGLLGEPKYTDCPHVKYILHKRYSPEISNSLRRLYCRVRVSRSLLAQITRHRTLSFSVESSRWCDYSNDSKFGGDIKFINRPFPDGEQPDGLDSIRIQNAYQEAEERYKQLRNHKLSPEVCRDILPMGLATEMFISGPVYAWRHFFNLRLGAHAEYPIKELARDLKKHFSGKLNIFFE
jgi:flavin-dependent thymidylate synthase